MTKTTTTPADAAEWADSLVVRHRAARPWPLDILGTGPRCTGMCQQRRALCVHPEACGVQHPVMLNDARLAPAEELQAETPRRISDQDRGEAIGSAIGWSVVALLCVMAAVHIAHVYGIGPGVARVAGWVAGFFR